MDSKFWLLNAHFLKLKVLFQTLITLQYCFAILFNSFSAVWFACLVQGHSKPHATKWVHKRFPIKQHAVKYF